MSQHWGKSLEIYQEEAYLINKEDHFHVIVDGS